MILIRFIKYILIFTLIVHVLHDTYVINTMEARINGRLDSIDLSLSNFEKDRKATAKAVSDFQKREVSSAMAAANRVAPNDLTVPHWPTEEKKQ